MSFTTFSGNTGNISALSDRPNDTDGLTAAQLKAKFDKAGDDIKTYLNFTLIPELEATTAGASIGVAATGITASTVTAALEELLADIAAAVIAGLTDDCVQTSYIQDEAVTTAKLDDGAVTTAKITDANVTEGKLASDAVVTSKIKDANVTTAKIADTAVTAAKLAANAVTTAKIADGNVTRAKIADDAINADKVDSSIQTRHLWFLNREIPRITSNNGTQTITGLTNLTNNYSVVVSPTEASFIEYRDCGVRCSSVGNGQATFKAESATSGKLYVNIIAFY